MEFDLVHVVRIPVEHYFDVVLSEDFTEWVKRKLQQDERRVIRLEEIDGLVHRTVRSGKDLGPKAQKRFKVPRFVVEEHLVIDRGRGHYTWKYVPNVGAQRVVAEGTGQVESHPDGVQLTIQGEVTFRIPLIGGRIARHMVTWVQENFAKMLDALEGYYRTEYKPKD